MIRSCTCISPYQDKLYGVGKRVFNEGVKELRCTVCGSKVSKPKKEEVNRNGKKN